MIFILRACLAESNTCAVDPVTVPQRGWLGERARAPPRRPIQRVHSHSLPRDYRLHWADSVVLHDYDSGQFSSMLCLEGGWQVVLQCAVVSTVTTFAP